jgi:hypothetical protein
MTLGSCGSTSPPPDKGLFPPYGVTLGARHLSGRRPEVRIGSTTHGNSDFRLSGNSNEGDARLVINGDKTVPLDHDHIAELNNYDDESYVFVVIPERFSNQQVSVRLVIPTTGGLSCDERWVKIPQGHLGLWTAKPGHEPCEAPAHSSPRGDRYCAETPPYAPPIGARRDHGGAPILMISPCDCGTDTFVINDQSNSSSSRARIEFPGSTLDPIPLSPGHIMGLNRGRRIEVSVHEEVVGSTRRVLVVVPMVTRNGTPALTSREERLIEFPATGSIEYDCEGNPKAKESRLRPIRHSGVSPTEMRSLWRETRDSDWARRYIERLPTSR